MKRREIFRKKISEGMGLEARDFFRKNFFGIRKYKILRDLSCASRRLGLGGAPLYYPKNGKFAANKALQTCETGETVQMYARKEQTPKTALKPHEMNVGTV